MAYLALASYRDSTHELSHIEFLIHEDDLGIWVAIRGTEFRNKTPQGSTLDLLDVLRNIRAYPWSLRYRGHRYRGHAGFIRGAEQVADALLQRIRPDRPVRLTGHSLGGALALVTAYLLEEQGHSVHEVVTFGAPRVFYFSVPYLQAPLTMYKNGNDLITEIPPGRHPVPQSYIGTPARPWGNLKDHGMRAYLKSLLKLERT